METKHLLHERKILKTILEFIDMKNLVIILSLVSFAAFSQDYTVIHTIGDIYDLSSGKHLTKGMKIRESTKLRFDSEGAKAAVLSTSKGRYIIQSQRASASQSDIAYTLSSIISPVRGRLSTRAGGINNAIDFSKHFEEEPIAILGPSYEVNISPEAYPVNESKFFYAQYHYNDEVIESLVGKKKVYLEQRSRSTARFIVELEA